MLEIFLMAMSLVIPAIIGCGLIIDSARYYKPCTAEKVKGFTGAAILIALTIGSFFGPWPTNVVGFGVGIFGLLFSVMIYHATKIDMLHERR